MEIEECKIKIANAAELLCGGLTVDADGLPDNWDKLADLTADMARHAATQASSIAAYASIARRKANKE